MLTTIYVSLGVPRMINYTATHNVVRDGIWDHMKEKFG